MSVKHWLAATCKPNTGDLGLNLGMCADWESNRQHFHAREDAQPTEPQRPGHSCFYSPSSPLSKMWMNVVCSLQYNRVFPTRPNRGNAILIMLLLTVGWLRRMGEAAIMCSWQDGSGNKHERWLDSILVMVLGSRPGFGLPEGSGDPCLSYLSVYLISKWIAFDNSYINAELIRWAFLNETPRFHLPVISKSR